MIVKNDGICELLYKTLQYAMNILANHSVTKMEIEKIHYMKVILVR